MVLDRRMEFWRFTLRGLAALAVLSLAACHIPEEESAPDVPSLGEVEQASWAG
jgi:hypothetical protein